MNGFLEVTCSLPQLSQYSLILVLQAKAEASTTGLLGEGLGGLIWVFLTSSGNHWKHDSAAD